MATPYLKINAGVPGIRRVFALSTKVGEEEEMNDFPPIPGKVAAESRRNYLEHGGDAFVLHYCMGKG
ncbi:hypothetical protein MASR2M17_00470 [Aminivibrio sp.]